MLTYPQIDPVALRLGPLAIRWYGLMYLFGFVTAYFIVQRRLAKTAPAYDADRVQGFMFWALAGLLVGARLGEIVFRLGSPDLANHRLSLDGQTHRLLDYFAPGTLLHLRVESQAPSGAWARAPRQTPHPKEKP